MATNGAPVGPPLPQMQVVGHSAATVRGKTVALNAFAKFLASTNGKYATSIDGIAAATLCDETIWLEFAHFLVHDPKEYKADTVVEYMRKTFGVVKDVHGKAGSRHFEFFAALEIKDRRNWLMGAIRQVCV
jgi:hypothetical protein